ncbi:MAG: hypothetical protein DMG54_33460 [Acidobacteria bacterium]|nr:MAG: hypothetical protein DMG54_33460 [Acidobacteriota bacterium]
MNDRRDTCQSPLTRNIAANSKSVRWKRTDTFMHLASLEVRNFRSLKNLSMKFRSGVNLIVGPNAVGKTTVLEAIPRNPHSSKNRQHGVRNSQKGPARGCPNASPSRHFRSRRNVV